MSERLTVKQVFAAGDGGKKSARVRDSRATRGFCLEELEKIGARALRLADLSSMGKEGPVDVPRVEALTELGHAALRLMAVQQRIKAQARERERKEA